jgi:hypothetical protein
MRDLFLITALHILTHLIFAQEHGKYIEDTYSLDKIRSITEFLASDDLEGRDTPSEGLESAAEYISSYFKKHGVKPLPDLEGYFQPVKMFSYVQPDQITVTHGKIQIDSPGSLLMVSGQSGFLSAGWEKIDSVDQNLENTNLSGKILVYIVDRNAILNQREILLESREVRSIAKEKGAAGILEVFKKNNRHWDGFQRFYGRTKISLENRGGKGVDIPHIILKDVLGDFETSFEKNISGLLSIEISGMKEMKFITHNVIGIVEGKDSRLNDEFIVCAAHYDHVGIGRPDAAGDSIYNGARDNAVGVMSVMMAAENVARYPTERPVLFVLFTGEEKGLLGSKWFVEYPPIPLNNIIFCLNTDGGGYNDTTIVTVIGKRRIKTNNLFEDACNENSLSAFEGTDNTQFLFNNSDNVTFSRGGIPSVTFSLGFRELDARILKHYHQPSDEVETLDFKYILKFTKSFGMALRMIADSEERLFWNEEDEFYKKGRILYQ